MTIYVEGFDSGNVTGVDGFSYGNAPNAPGSFDFSNLVFTPASLTAGVLGIPYSEQFSTIGLTAPLTWTIIDGALPDGITLDTSGLLSGTPESYGTFNFVIQVQDVTGISDSEPYTWQINELPIVITPAPLTNGTQGSFYSQQMSADGGITPYTWTVTSGTLPTGLTLTNGGLLSGTPTLVEDQSFTITATDSFGSQGSQVYAMQILARTVTVLPSTLTAASVGSTYYQLISQVGGATPVSFAVTDGTLPNGITLSSSGVLTGIPTDPGTSTFTITCTDLYGNEGYRIYTWDVVRPTLVIQPTTLRSGSVGIFYSETLTCVGAVGAYTFSVTAGSLPSGFTLTSLGELSGLPTTATVADFTLTVVDSYDNTVSTPYTFTIVSPTISIVPGILPNQLAGLAYNQQLQSYGGVAPYTYTLTSGTLPIGLTLSSSGQISGTCLLGATSTFDITSTDSFGSFSTTTYTVIIQDYIAPVSLNVAKQGVPYTTTVGGVGGVDPYTYSITIGFLPPGITLVDNVISGTPTLPGRYSFVMTAIDDVGTHIDQNYQLTVEPSPIITLYPQTLPKGYIGQAYSVALTTRGGTAPFTYGISSGTLPAGLTINPATGVISGTPTGPVQTNTFIVSAEDTNGFFGYAEYTIAILQHATVPASAVKVYVGGTLQPSGLFVANTTANSNVLANVSNFDNLSVGTHLQGIPITGNVVIASIDTANNRVIMSNVAANTLGRTQISYSTGYRVSNKDPVTIAFDTAPPEGQEVTIAVEQGDIWYDPGVLTASSGIPLQECTTPAAEFLQGK